DDAFYAVTQDDVRGMARRGVLAVEMEASALFTLGALRGVSTGCVLVVSNNIGDDTFLPAEQLRPAVLDMVTAALDAMVELAGACRPPLRATPLAASTRRATAPALEGELRDEGSRHRSRHDGVGHRPDLRPGRARRHARRPGAGRPR